MNNIEISYLMQLQTSDSVEFYKTKFKTFQILIRSLFFGYNLIFYAIFFGSYIIAGNKLAANSDNEVLDVISITISNITYQNFFLACMISLYSTYFFLDVIDTWLKKIVNEKFVTGKHDLEVLRLVSTIMDKLCDVMEVGNSSSRMNIATFVHYFSFFGVICTYSGILIIVFDDNTELSEFFNMSGVWIVYNSIFFAWIFAFSSLIKKKCQIIELTCIKFLTKSESTPKTGKSIQHLSLQLFHRRPIFSCQMFNIDWIFLFHLIAESFSYLVIIFQFDINLYK